MDKPTDNTPTSRHHCGAGKSSFPPARLHSISLLRKAGTALCEPVVGSPRLLIWLTLTLACAPLAQMLFSGATLLRLALYALLQSFFWSYLLCALLLIIPDGKARKYISRILALIAALGALPDLGCTAFTGTPFTADSVSLILETTSAEAGGFFTQYLTAGAVLKILLYYILCAACALSLPALTKYIRQTTARKWLGLRSVYSRYLMPFCGFVLLATALGGGFNASTLLRGVFIQQYTSYLVWQGEMPSDNPVLSRFNRLKFGDIPSKWANIANEISLRDAEIHTWEARQKEVLAMFNGGGI